MRAVRADRELKLEQELVGALAFRVSRVAILSTDLAELARPVGEHQRPAGVAQRKGFFKDEGLDADIVVMGAAPSIAALSNGDIDFTLLTGTVIRAAIRGLPVRLVAGLMTSSPHVLLARADIK